MADVNALPPGWDCKYDTRTSRYYFINHYTKVTTWEDPRIRYRQIHGTPNPVVEHIPLQDLSNLSAARMSPANISRASTSTPAHKASPLVSQAVSRMQETSLTPAATDTEQSVAKISTMFPTVTETHIRLLLKKYYNREAVVISALQVEKYPITTPGPFTTPPPSRNFPPSGVVHVPLHGTPPPGLRNAAATLLSRSGSPLTRTASGTSAFGSGGGENRASPKPHSSPKMKLRYMKSIFPQVDENILLEALGNNENNVQKASEALKEMGYEKRDIKLAKAKSSRQEAAKQAELAAARATPPPKMLNLNEKKAMKTALQNKYEDIPERVIVIALESVDYNDSRACQILDIMMQEESSSKSSSGSTSKKDDTSPVYVSTGYGGAVEFLRKSKSSLITPSPSSQTLRADKLDAKQTRRTKERNNSARGPMQESKMNDGDSYKSVYLVQTTGPDSSLAKGSDNGVLLEDYVSWDGPDPGLREGSRGLAKGPNAQLLMGRTYQPCGPDASNCKGPARGLVQGSIYTQLVAGGEESRGK